jgi:DNA-binding transcriptional MerR regulator
MSLAGMRKYSELTTQGEAAAPQHRALLEEHQRVLEERLRQMKRNLEYVGARRPTGRHSARPPSRRMSRAQTAC